MPWADTKQKTSTLGRVTNTDGSQYTGTGQMATPPRTNTNKDAVHGWIEPKATTNDGIPCQIQGLEALLEGGWPQGSIIGLTGVGKTGKTSFALQEAILQARAKRSVTYLYNESPQARFMAIAHKHRTALDIPTNQLETMRFFNMHGSTLKDPKPASIEKYAGWLVNTLRDDIQANNTEFVVLDSLTKFCRLWPAQAYYYVQQFTQGLWKAMAAMDKHPVVLAIAQKSGGHWEEQDATMLGGHGVGHELDGTIVFVRRAVDTWVHRELGLPLGGSLRTIRIDSLRDRDTDDSSHLLVQHNGRLSIGSTEEDIRTRYEATQDKKPKAKGGGKQWGGQ